VSFKIHAYKLFDCCRTFSLPPGLYGSIKEDYCTLLAFSIILSLVITFEICLGVSAFALAQENRLASTIAEKMEISLNNYGRKNFDGVTKGVVSPKSLKVFDHPL
jgi:hypothetical protein